MCAALSLYLRPLALTPVAPVFVHAPLALCRNISECGLVVVDIAVRAGVCVRKRHTTRARALVYTLSPSRALASTSHNGSTARVRG